MPNELRHGVSDLPPGTLDLSDCTWYPWPSEMGTETQPCSACSIPISNKDIIQGQFIDNFFNEENTGFIRLCHQCYDRRINFPRYSGE